MTDTTTHRMAQSSDPHFADRLISRVRELGHPLCLGLDPHLAQIPPLFQRGDMGFRCLVVGLAIGRAEHGSYRVNCFGCFIICKKGPHMLP